MPYDPTLRAHQEWLGYVQPVGVVVSPAALVANGCLLRLVFVLYAEDRALDVEQIGSVYEAIMGFTLLVASGPVIAVPSRKKGSAVDVHLDVASLLALPGADRARRLKDEADCDLTGEPLAALKAARSPDDLASALGRKLSKRTPRPLPAGSLYLQPTEERRRSGSHYTPRSLTEPIVRTTLEPVLAALGSSPTPAQVLGLKVCDPAMGSGAFLVETCRFLGDALLRAWDAHGGLPEIPPDEDPVLYARRQVAQLCLYGVDKNPFAVDLAKLSLWLATLAKDHPFTFLDDSLRHGDSLVGLSPGQIERFHWEESGQQPLLASRIRAAMDAAMEKRSALEALNDADHETQEALLVEADGALADVRLAGDLVIAAFFGGKKPKEREALRAEYEGLYEDVLSGRRPRGDAEAVVAALRAEEKPVFPFHWGLAFPEVFARENPGFDAFVGNPPFLGGTLIGGQLGLRYHEFLVESHPPATGLADLVAFFLRRSFGMLRRNAAFGLIATNTVAQGDTRSAGLQAIVQAGGEIYSAKRRYGWPGLAAVVVSVVHVRRGLNVIRPTLDDSSTERISAFLLPGGVDAMPAALLENRGRGFAGTKVWGAGFIFEDPPSGGSSSLTEMKALLAQDPRNREVLFAFLGGEEFNADPGQRPRRFTIEFGEMSETEARAWPSLFSILEERVRPVRAVNKQRNYRENWWLHANRVSDARPYVTLHGRMLALTSVSKHLSTAFVGPGTIVSNSMILLLLHRNADFALIQSRVHEIWARFVGSSMKDDLRYTPSDCFDTFPFPPSGLNESALEDVGKEYYDFRAALMIRNGEGLTRTYNRFHDPEDTSPDIIRLRALHDAMDRAVLDAYGWTDLHPTCDFLLDYEDEDDEGGDSGRTRQRKKPWRCRWPDDIRDEVLARLLALNKAQSHEDTARADAAASKSHRAARPARPSSEPAWRR